VARRIVVIGCSGSGKTMFARAVSRRLGLDHIEMDSLHHLPDWQERPREEMWSMVDARTAGPRWVVDGNYSMFADLTWGRADTVVFLDLPRRTVMRQVIWRSLCRVVMRTELWHGNRERWRNLTSWNPEESIIRWAWTRWPSYRDRFAQARNDPRWGHLAFVVLRSRRQVRAYLRRLPSAQQRGGVVLDDPDR
jgi:adenylate kinase family enzyme